MTNSLSGIESWAEFLSGRKIPVLRQTVRAIEDAREYAERVSVRKIAAIVLHDPLMTVRLLRFCAQRRSKRQLQDISTVEHAVMMLGVEPFFHHFAQFDVVEDQLRQHPQALLGLLHLIHRSKRAARYALDWATWRYDLNSEEVAVAALLHDLAQMLVCCFAPQRMLEILARQKASSAMRGDDVEKAVLGFTLHDLQALLCWKWQLPELLASQMDDRQADRPRVRNVRLAVNLARHSAKGWDDPALADDFRAIAALMNIDEATLMLRLGLSKPGEKAAASPVR